MTPLRVMILPLVALSLSLTTAASCSKEPAPEKNGGTDGGSANANANANGKANVSDRSGTVADGGGGESGSAKARAIVAEMKELYATCDSYEDEGLTEPIHAGVFYMGGGSKPQPFFTTFKRGDGFRFEERIHHPGLMTETIIIWAKGDKVRFRGYNPMWFNEEVYDEEDDDAEDDGDEDPDEVSEEGKDDDETSADDFVVQGTGVSGADGEEAKPTLETAIHRASRISEIPRLLMPDRFESKAGLDFGELQEIQLAEEEEIDGAACYKIAGKLLDLKTEHIAYVSLWDPSADVRVNVSATLWIDKESKLLRKLEQEVSFVDAGTATPGSRRSLIPRIRLGWTQHFKPRMNHGLEWHDLLFGVPDAFGEEGWGEPFGDRAFKPTKKSKADAESAAEKVIKSTIKKYATAKSYRDSGVIETAPTIRGLEPRTSMKFRTAYIRPSQFRYDVRERAEDGETWSPYIIWSDGGKVRSWWHTEPGVREWQTLADPARDMSARTFAPILTVAGLMMPAMGEESLLRKGRGFVLLGYEEIAKKRCYKICGRDELGWPFTVWIDKKSKLILRAEEKYIGKHHPTYRTTTYKPRINKKVADKYLKFDPPEK